MQRCFPFPGEEFIMLNIIGLSSVCADATFSFDWISIVFLVIVVLGLFIGLYKGIGNSFLTLIGLAIAVFGGIFLATYVGDAVKKIGTLRTEWATSLYGYFLKVNGEASTQMTYDLASTNISDIISKFKLPSSFSGSLSASTLALMKADGDACANTAIGMYVAYAVMDYAFIAIGFLIAFLVILIVCAVIGHYIKKALKKNKAVSGVNRLIGGVVGLAIACLIVVVIAYGMQAISGVSKINELYESTMHLSDSSVNSISKWLYTNNFLNKIIQYLTAQV